MKNLLVLGASYSQVPLIKAAQRLGCYVIAASIPGNYAGLEVANEVVNADITKPEEVYEAVKDKGIDAVTTCCMDVGMKAQGYLCEMLSLPGPKLFAATAASDKSIEKAAYKAHGVNTAGYEIVHNVSELEEALDNLRFPVILKAVDQMGSRGVFRSDTREQALENFALSMAATSKDFCIVEEFLIGEMFGVEAMVSGGELAYVLPLGNVLHDGNPPFPIGHFVPWKDDDQLGRRVVEQTQAVVRALEFNDCAMDMDCMLVGDDVYVIEATARAGATCITDTVSIYYGIDYYEAIVRVALGEDVHPMFNLGGNQGVPSITRLLESYESGIVDAVLMPEELPDAVVDLSYNVSPGDEVRPMSNGRDRIGQLIIRGETLDECRNLEGDLLPLLGVRCK